jgi:hypothetical protein
MKSSRGFTALAGLLAAAAIVSSMIAGSLNVGAAAPQPSFYANYPASATANQSCSASDLVTVSYYIGSWSGTSLIDAPQLTPGITVGWAFTNTDPDCTSDVATLALYATAQASFSYSDQTSAATASDSVPQVSQINRIFLTVPSTFDGPYQLDAIFGQPLPLVGPDGNYYGGVARTVQSDGRDMLVSSTLGAIGSVTNWSDETTQPFDYGDYPTDVYSDPSDPCNQGNGIATYGSNLGFTVNGVLFGLDTSFVLHAGDVVTFSFLTTSSACSGQNLCLALYRNPGGGDGLVDRTINQRLVTADCAAGTLNGGVTTITLNVPTTWDGGYQLDAVVGTPLPVVGDAGGTYGAAGTLEASNYNIMGAAQ